MLNVVHKDGMTGGPAGWNSYVCQRDPGCGHECDNAAGDNHGNFKGEILGQAGTQTEQHLLTLNGLLDDTKEGSCTDFDNTFIWLIITEERALRIFSKGLIEKGPAGVLDDQLNQSYSCADVKTTNFSIDITPVDSSKASCKVTLHFSTTVQQQ